MLTISDIPNLDDTIGRASIETIRASSEGCELDPCVLQFSLGTGWEFLRWFWALFSKLYNKESLLQTYCHDEAHGWACLTRHS